MYTTVFYKENADGTYELVRTHESGGIPKFNGAKHPFYIQKGEFDGVVDPSKDIRPRSEEERVKDLESRLKVTEDAFFRLLNE
ncbi:hypothetical protein [Halobacillus karajensis]|uniref:Uncharacterized protein n=1 Tax=Halobacillus karajensis TaxID=195088 RepID=A0A059NUX6_9BACI|nr:hypothetical protein [Halobacillus karajensis]CDQ22564.1 hypothetical protein BN983_00777 [Halobacillus karajensis]CDQ26046.1 hypothetical protein BN981_00257 [Halobacillus karajensis]